MAAYPGVTVVVWPGSVPYLAVGSFSYVGEVVCSGLLRGASGLELPAEKVLSECVCGVCVDVCT